MERYAYAALKGKVRDWLRTGGAQERLLGVGVELERKGGTTGSFQGGVDTKILFQQLKATLGERDGYILALLLEDKSALEIATELGTAYPMPSIETIVWTGKNHAKGLPQTKVGYRTVDRYPR